MAVRRDYRDYVLEQLAGLGGVRSRPMFGGVGLYCEEHFFGLIADDTLYLRVDDSNRTDYTARGMRAFRPYADRPQLSTTYYEIPAEILEDATQLASWAQRSLAAAKTRAAHQSAARPRRRRHKR